jgi:hypothetical protein
MLVLKIANRVMQIAGPITLLLGLLIWFTSFDLVMFHMTFGTLVALSLLTTSIALATRKGGRLLGLSGVVYAFVIPAFGMAQLQLITVVGGAFWVIRVLHMLVGIGAMVLSARQFSQYKKLVVKPAEVKAGVEALVR